METSDNLEHWKKMWLLSVQMKMEDQTRNKLRQDTHLQNPQCMQKLEAIVETAVKLAFKVHLKNV